jgi:hypothetical protein
MKRCPHCGQEWTGVRLRGRLTPIKAHILSIITRAGRDGASLDWLQDTMPDHTRSCIKVHIHQLNKLIDEEGYFIAKHSGNYVLQLRNVAA